MNTQLTDADFISFCCFTAHYCHPLKKETVGRRHAGYTEYKKGPTEVADAHWMTKQNQGSLRIVHVNAISCFCDGNYIAKYRSTRFNHHKDIIISNLSIIYTL